MQSLMCQTFVLHTQQPLLSFQEEKRYKEGVYTYDPRVWESKLQNVKEGKQLFSILLHEWEYLSTDNRGEDNILVSYLTIIFMLLIS